MDAKLIQYHADILGNRVKKNYKHFAKRFRKQHIDCFRLYDWDIPEVRAVVDWYAGHVVIAEYTRTQTTVDWLPKMAEGVAKALEIPQENVHIKHRVTNVDDRSGKYQQLDNKNERFVVTERELKLWVNLNDFLDTGLYSDHRETRKYLSCLIKDMNFLNLFAYTGSFTCCAALGGAKTTTTVDRSVQNLKWAQDNMALNGLQGDNHSFFSSDVEKYLKNAYKDKKKFDVCVVDPPSFYKDQKTGSEFDINKHHVKLLESVCKVMKLRGTILFSTNHQRFESKLRCLKVKDIKELTPKTIPEDYRNKKVHRCWEIIV